jgi:acyl-coenzyme A thioesterase PaaI-like protein
MTENDVSDARSPAARVGADALDQVAAAMRDLGHRVAEHEIADGKVAAEIAGTLRLLAAQVASLPPLQRDQQAELERMLGARAEDGDPLSAGPHCPVTGSGNPLGLAGIVTRQGDEAVGRFTFQAASSGLPGITHGGHVAAAIDGLLGLALVQIGRTAAVTARLTINYLAPVPTGREIVFIARITEQNGRKYTVEAVGRLEDQDIVRASALFIRPRDA